MEKQFDLAVIGSGPGGHAAAEWAAKLGARVALIEKEEIGGTCTNTGCIPTKALLLCSEYYAKVQHLEALGIDTSGVSFSFERMKSHQMRSTQVTRAGIELAMAKHGVEIIRGEGHLVDPNTIEIRNGGGAQRLIKAQYVVIAWGSTPLSVPGVALSDRIVNSDGLLQMAQLPQNITLVGGGVIGVEFATFLSEVGVKVQLVNMAERILLNEEPAASQLIEKCLETNGVEMVRQARMQSATDKWDHVDLVVSQRSGERTIASDVLLLAIGRRPVLFEAELNALDISYSERGIMVNDNQETSVPGIYALGDVTGGIQLAHRASHQGKAVASQLFGDGSVKYQEMAVASVTYTHPPVARVGLTEAQARAEGLPIVVKERQYEDNALAQVELAGEGFVKVIFRLGGELLGATIVGAKASELIAPLSLAISHHFTENDFKPWIIAHPTISEILGETIL